MVIGLTGNIASGKSTISSHLSEKGYDIIDADMISRYIMEPGQEGYLGVLRVFGLQYLLPDGSIDRKKLGEDVFSSPVKLKMLNDLTHPIIVSAIEDELKTSKSEVTVIDAPLLKQVGLERLCDEVWIVTVDDKIRLKRLMDRNGYSREEASRRMSSQEKIQVAEGDIIFENNGSVEELIYKVDKRLRELSL